MASRAGTARTGSSAKTRALPRRSEALREVGLLLKWCPDAALIVDNGGCITMLNAEAERMFGYSGDALRGQPVEVLLPEPLRQAHAAQRAHYFLRPYRRSLGSRLNIVGRRRDGSEFPADIMLGPIETRRGVFALGIIRDLTERRRLEEALRESQQWLAATLRDIGDAVIATDREGRVTFLNETAQAQTGWSQQDAAGRPLADVFQVVNEETGAPAEDPLANVLRDGVVVGLGNHTVLITRDGTRRPIGDSAAPIRDAQGNITGVVVVFHDVSDRRRAEAALHEQEELLRTVVNSAPLVLWALDRRGVFTVSDGKGLEALGLRPGEVVGRSVFEVYRDVVQIQEDTRRALAGEEFTSIVDVNGRVFESRYSPARDSAGNVVGVMGIATDITQQQRTAEELRQLTARLLEAQEEERRQVAYDIHDGLGQLMTAASMHLEVFAGGRQALQAPEVEGELEKARRCLRDAVVEMRRMVSEVGPLLLEGLGLVEASRRLLSDMAERLNWQTEFEGEPNGGRLDPMVETALFRIVQEGLANAAKHSGTTRVRVAFTRRDGELELEVRDWGQGFDAGRLLAESAKGRHVGLLGMRERAALIEGEFQIESHPGAGTRLTVRAPLALPVEPISGSEKLEVMKVVEAGKGRGPAPPGITVLIVDDHPMVREGLRSMLDAEGIAVIGEAATGGEAVQRVQELDPDVVLMDVRMPDMDGLAATEVVKQSSSHTSVIIVTSYESKEYLRRAIEVGAAGYLLKGMSRDSLIDAIRLVRGGGSLVDARLLAELLREMGVQGERYQAAEEGTLEALTPREREVLQLLVQGLTNKEIAQQMHYSVGTVKNAVQRIIEKLGVSDRTQAAVYAVRAGLPLA